MGLPTGIKGPCPKCRKEGRDTAGDNLVEYNDGSAHCFACGYNRRGTQVDDEDTDKMNFEDIANLPIRPLEKRGIGVEAAKLYGVRTEADLSTGEDAAYYFPLYRAGKLVGYQRKVARKPGQRQSADTTRLGETKGCDAFGSNVAGKGGGMVIVTEGGEDCLAAVELLARKGKRYRVIATLGVNGWKRILPYLESFTKVIIAFDQDGAGKESAQQLAAALSVGKGRIMRWADVDDPNALLFLKDGGDRFLDSINRAEAYRPDGIIFGEEVWRYMENFVEPEYIPYPQEWEKLNEKIKGMRLGEISLWTSGTGSGKTTYIRRLKQHVLTQSDWKIGEIELEERAQKTFRGLMQFQAGARWADMTQEQRRQAFEATYGTKRIFTLDHRSQYGKGQSLIGKFKHLHFALGCKIIFLDHITLAVNEFGEGQGNVAQDQMMNEFLEFVETTNTHLCLISHLRKTGLTGQSFEEGAVPCADDLKGSGSLKQISFDIVGVSRNQQHENDYERNVSQLHVIKCRETGNTGKADRMFWDGESQSLVPAAEKPEQEMDDNEEF